MSIKKKVIAAAGKDTLFDEDNSSTVTGEELSNLVKSSMMEYGMHVIEDRAIPNALDGLKPVQRRSLYAYRSGNHTGKFVKLARIVGDVIGQYHPHGDQTVAGSIVQMSQPFKNNFVFLDKQGNWGSISGASNAAMRYIETKLSDASADLLFENLDKENVVPWVPNYDQTTKEPELLPVKYPVHLVNGTSGIAYGLATSIPSYNIREMTNLFIFLIDQGFWKKAFSVDDHRDAIMDIVPSVDFPTGANIYFDSKFDPQDAIFSHRFSLRMRASYEIDEKKHQIAFYNIPINLKTDNINDQILNARLSYKFKDKAKKVKTPKDPSEILNISDSPLIIPDETDATILLTFNKSADLVTELAKVFKYTSLDEAFGANIKVIDEDGLPVEISFYDNIVKFLYFRRHVVYQSQLFDIKKLEAQIHLLEGIIIVLANKAEFIKIVTETEEYDEIPVLLNSAFGLSQEQIAYLLDMKISKLTRSEVSKVQDDVESKRATLVTKQEIVANSDNIFEFIKNDYLSILESRIFKDTGRRSKLLTEVRRFNSEDLIKDKSVIVMLLEDDTVSYIDKSKFKIRNRGAKSQNAKVNDNGYENMNMVIAEECALKDDLLLISSRGRAFKIKAWRLPQQFSYIGNVLNIQQDEAIIHISRYDDTIEQYSLLTEKGKIKGLAKSLIQHVTENRATQIVRLDDGDKVINFRMMTQADNEKAILLTSDGKIIKFPSSHIPVLKGGQTRGVRGVDLNEGTRVIKMFFIDEAEFPESVVIACSDIGQCKKTKVDSIPEKKRAQKPVVFFNQSASNGQLVGGDIITDSATEVLMVVTEKGNVSYVKIGDFNDVGRTAKGSVKVVNTSKQDKVKVVKKISIAEDVDGVDMDDEELDSEE